MAVIHGGESFVALAEALQNAFALCGGVSAEHRTDSLSACFRNPDASYAGDYTSRYRELCVLGAQLQIDILPGESWRQLWRMLLTALSTLANLLSGIQLRLLR